MRAIKVIVAVWVLTMLILWVRDWRRFSVLDTLPFVHRSTSLDPIYDWAALAMIFLGLWGYSRLRRRGGQ